MIRRRARWLLAVLVCLALSAACARQDAGRGMKWMTSTVSGSVAVLEGDYAEAEKHFAAALKETRDFEPHEPGWLSNYSPGRNDLGQSRLAISLNNLAYAYHAQGRI